MTKLIALIILGLVIVSIISLLINVYNNLIMLKNNASKAFANIDVLLKQRADEIPNLVTIVKASAKYEQETLQKLTELRTRYINSNNIDEKVEISNEIGSSLKTLFAVSENYPALKANASFMQLQTRISQMEDNIADRREFYNESINMYNIGIAEFPNIILAKLLSYKERNMLYISDEEKKYDGAQF